MPEASCALRWAGMSQSIRLVLTSKSHSSISYPQWGCCRCFPFVFQHRKLESAEVNKALEQIGEAAFLCIFWSFPIWTGAVEGWGGDSCSVSAGGNSTLPLPLDSAECVYASARVAKCSQSSLQFCSPFLSPSQCLMSNQDESILPYPRHESGGSRSQDNGCQRWVWVYSLQGALYVGRQTSIRVEMGENGGRESLTHPPVVPKDNNHHRCQLEHAVIHCQQQQQRHPSLFIPRPHQNSAFHLRVRKN